MSMNNEYSFFDRELFDGLFYTDLEKLYDQVSQDAMLSLNGWLKSIESFLLRRGEVEPSDENKFF